MPAYHHDASMYLTPEDIVAELAQGSDENWKVTVLAIGKLHAHFRRETLAARDASRRPPLYNAAPDLATWQEANVNRSLTMLLALEQIVKNIETTLVPAVDSYVKNRGDDKYKMWWAKEDVELAAILRGHAVDMDKSCLCVVCGGAYFRREEELFVCATCGAVMEEKQTCQPSSY